MTRASEHFTVEELRCKHCGSFSINPATLNKLEALRTEADFPFPISSAYRCPNHPAERAKSEPGCHTEGRAFDIVVSHQQALWVVSRALDHGFTGVGLKQHGDNRFVHLDDCPGSALRPRPHIWSYPDGD